MLTTSSTTRCLPVPTVLGVGIGERARMTFWDGCNTAAAPSCPCCSRKAVFRISEEVDAPDLAAD
jgi:hypothetical protein